MNESPQYKMAETERLVPYARNSRTHSESQVDKVAASIKEFGFLNPVIVDSENGIIAGHCRVMAAKRLGLTEIPVLEASHLNENQKRAYVIADNRLALDAGWDEAMIRVEFDSIEEAGFDLDITGFEAFEVEEIRSQWESDFLPPEKDGSHTDGIESVLKVRVAQVDRDEAMEAMTNALQAAGVDYEIG